MFAGSVTGGIPGSGTDRSATGPATGQVTAVLDAERAGDSRTVLGCGVGAGARAGVREAGRKITTPTTTTAADTPDNHTRRLARPPAGQPTLLIPILPCPGQVRSPVRRRLHRCEGSKPRPVRLKIVGHGLTQRGRAGGASRPGVRADSTA